MIDEVIRHTPSRLRPSGRLFLIFNSASDFPNSMMLMDSVGLEPRVIAERSRELRPLFDRAWLDELGGPLCGLYSIRDGHAYETIRVVEAILR